MKKLLSLAIDIARQNNKKRYNFVSIIADKRDRILSIGANSYSKTHPLQLKYALMVGQDERIFLHSEIDAIVKCKRPASKIYIARVNNTGKIKSAKPCPICEKAIKLTGISEVYYT